MIISIIVPIYILNNIPTLLKSLQKQKLPLSVKLQIVIVSDGACDAVNAELPNVVRSALSSSPFLDNIDNLIIVKIKHNVGYSSALSIGAFYAVGNVIYFMNDDIELTSEDLLSQVSLTLIANKNLGVVSPQIFENSKPIYIGLTNGGFLPKKTLKGCMMCVNKNIIGSCGALDPEFYLYAEEDEFCERVARNGFVNGVLTRVHCNHRRAQTMSNESILDNPYVLRRIVISYVKNNATVVLKRCNLLLSYVVYVFYILALLLYYFLFYSGRDRFFMRYIPKKRGRLLPTGIYSWDLTKRLGYSRFEFIFLHLNAITSLCNRLKYINKTRYKVPLLSPENIKSNEINCVRLI